MAGIGVREIKTVEITTTDGKKIKRGDILCLSIKGKDIVCRFCELDNQGYFCTISIVTGSLIKYRPNSITLCYKVTDFIVDTDQPLYDVVAPIADYTNQDTLSPAT